MKTHFRSIIAGVSLFSVSGWADADLSKLPPPSTTPGLTYAKDIKPLFEASCIRCHGDEKQKGDLRLDSLEAVLKGGEEGRILVAGKSLESALVVAVSGLDEETAMPPKRKPGKGGPGGPGGTRPAGAPPGGPGGPGGFTPPKPFTPEQVGLIRAWIDQGAK